MVKNFLRKTLSVLALIALLAIKSPLKTIYTNTDRLLIIPYTDAGIVYVEIYREGKELYLVKCSGWYDGTLITASHCVTNSDYGITEVDQNGKIKEINLSYNPHSYPGFFYNGKCIFGVLPEEKIGRNNYCFEKQETTTTPYVLKNKIIYFAEGEGNPGDSGQPFFSYEKIIIGFLEAKCKNGPNDCVLILPYTPY